MSDSVNPTAYDRLQNNWIYGGIFLWALSIIVAIATTADVTRAFAKDDREEIAELRERLAVVEAHLAERK